MREIRKVTKKHAPEEEEAIRNLSYGFGSLIKRINEIKKATKRHAPNGKETKRILPKEIIIKMDTTIRMT